MRKKPKQLTARQSIALTQLNNPALAELMEAEYDGTLEYKRYEGLLFKRRVKAKPRRTRDPAASEIFEATTNGTVKIANRGRMRRIELRIIALTGLALNGNMEAAEMLMDMRRRSKLAGDFVLEEEFERYPAGAPASTKKDGK